MIITKYIRNGMNAFLHHLSVAFLWLRLKIQKLLGLVSVYQSDPFRVKNSDDPRVRVCEERYRAFSAYLPKDQALSVIDVGCNQGYFLFRMAPYASIGIGIEKAYNEVMYARALAGTRRINNLVFMSYSVTPDNIRSFPSMDVVIFLSVFHHWVRDFGENEAKVMLKELAQKSRKYFIFETGQYEEKGKKWTDALAFMAPDSHQWIVCFLQECGFQNIHDVGKFSTTVTDIPRKLYVAVK